MTNNHEIRETIPISNLLKKFPSLTLCFVTFRNHAVEIEEVEK